MMKLFSSYCCWYEIRKAQSKLQTNFFLVFYAGVGLDACVVLY